MADSQSLIGQTVSHYRILEKIGGGGMGVVYKAEDTRLHRFVALKFLPSDVAADRATLERFRREAEAASALNHPNICTIYDIGEQDGIHFITMEFLDGKTLRHCIEGKSLPVERVLDWGIQIAEGLNAAHAEGIIHRDVKSANIFVTKHGHAKILDFGLAKLVTAKDGVSGMPTVTADELLTSPGATVGTVAYMSPEQARGEELDGRSDLFSFGSVLYEMTTGRPPFSGNTSAVMFEAILNRAPISPSTANRNLPADLERIITKALEKDREVRYQSAAELRADLKRVLRDTTSGKIAAVQPELGKSSSRLPVYAAGTLAALALLALGFFIYRWQTGSSLVPPSEWVQLTDFVDAAVAPALSPDGRMLAFLRGQGTFVTHGDVYLKLLPNGKPVQLTHDGIEKMSPVFSPDGSQVAYTVPGHWDTWIVPTLGGDPRLMLPNGSGLTWIDAQHMLFSEIKQGRHMVIVSAMENRNAERDVYPPPGEGSMAHHSYASPDRKWALVVWMNTLGGWQPCQLAALDGSAVAKPVGPPDAECTAAAWSPNGRWMYFSSASGGSFHIWRQRFPDGVPEQLTSGVTEEEGIAVAPDGGSLVTSVGAEQSSVWVHDRGGNHQITSEAAAFLTSPDGTASRSLFSPDGRRVYYLLRRSRHNSSVELWVSELGSGANEVQVGELSASGFDLSPDGHSVAYSLRSAEGRASIWIASVDHVSPPRHIESASDNFGPIFAPDGSVFFMSSEGEQTFIYRMNQDGTGRRKVIPDPVVQMQTVSPDGQWVIVQIAFPGEDPPRGVVAISTSSTERIRLCRGVCGVRWALDGRSLFLSVPGVGLENAFGWATFIIPLPPGRLFPKLPSTGVAVEREAAAILGAKRLEEYALPGANDGIYTFYRVTVHRNLFRIPLS